MHELSIAQSLLDLVLQHVSEDQVELVRCVRVRVGPLSGVDPASLAFCFDALAASGPLPNAQIEIVAVPATAACLECHHRFDLLEPICSCPSCGATRLRAQGGNDLLLGEIVLEDAPAEAKVSDRAKGA